MRYNHTEAVSMGAAHTHGWHAERAREGCPDCESRPLSSYEPFHVGQLVTSRARPGAAWRVLHCRRDDDCWHVLLQANSDRRWSSAEQLMAA